MNTLCVKPSEIKRTWYVIDATDLVLGRLSAEIARLLMGKNKPYFSPNLDCGDYVIVLNAKNIHLTGNKLKDKQYYWHTGYPGGIKNRTAKDIMNGKFPNKVIEKAVQRMISRSPLGRAQFKKLFVYNDNEHKHEAQKPQVLDFASFNRKNKKSI